MENRLRELENEMANPNQNLERVFKNVEIPKKNILL